MVLTSQYIKSVDYCSGEWIVCGGGPQAGVFHLRSGGLITPLPPVQNSDSVAITAFVKENDASSIITAGEIFPQSKSSYHFFICLLFMCVTS